MTSFEFSEATVAKAQTALTLGEVSSRELAEACLKRIEAYDQQGPALNAVSTINKRALSEAEQLDKERRERGPRGPLHGIPVLVKDNYETSDMQTAAGSVLLKGWVPPEDAFLVKRLREAGAVVVAKSNMHEFAYSITNQGSLFGATRNPYLLERNPGGSSGGTGAAIAANFAIVGWGSDTCGSIRIPSAHNCLVGLRPTQGLLSRTGIIPLSHTQDTGGPMARTVTDVAIALDATVGYDAADPPTAMALGNVPKSYVALLSLDALQGARIGLLTDLLQIDDADQEVADIIRDNTRVLADLGADVHEVSIPGLDELLNDRVGGYLIIRNEFRFDIDTYLARRPTAPVRSLAEIVASGKTHPSIADKLDLSLSFEGLDTLEYRDHLLKRNRLKIAIYQALIENHVEVLVYPSIRRTAFPIGQEQEGTNCKLSANSGLPAISVPAGFSPEGLPVGLEILGREWDEATLLRFAYAFEQGTRVRRPPVSTPAL